MNTTEAQTAPPAPRSKHATTGPRPRPAPSAGLDRLQVLLVEDDGADAFLVGEALVGSSDPGEAVRRLTGRPSEGHRAKERT